MLTIAETIETGDVALGFALNNNATRQLFGGGPLSKNAPVIIAMATDALRWGHNGNAQTDQTLRALADYCYWLYDKAGLQAQRALAIATGGGSVIPGGGFTRPAQFSFQVDSGSFIATGATSKTFPSSWKGFDILFTRGGGTQTEVPDSFNTYYSWDKDNAVLTLFGPAPANGAAQETEIFQFSPV